MRLETFIHSFFPINIEKEKMRRSNYTLDSRELVKLCALKAKYPKNTCIHKILLITITITTTFTNTSLLLGYLHPPDTCFCHHQHTQANCILDSTPRCSLLPDTGFGELTSHFLHSTVV